MGDTTAAIKYCHEDHLGNGSLYSDENGVLINREEYYPFGGTSFGSYAKKKYRYNGKEKDEESGLYYYGMRYYAPWTLRFYSIDPKSPETVHQSSYCYADNNPIMFQDVNGESTGDEGKGGYADNNGTVHNYKWIADFNNWVEKNIGIPARNNTSKINDYVDKSIRKPLNEKIDNINNYVDDNISKPLQDGSDNINKAVDENLGKLAREVASGINKEIGDFFTDIVNSGELNNSELTELTSIKRKSS